MQPIIHRANLSGYPNCGAERGHVSRSGVVVTCSKCVRLEAGLTREQAMAQIQAAADRYRESA